MSREKKKRKHSDYDKEYRDSAIEVGLRLGASSASRELGIPRSTIRNWIIDYRKRQNGQVVSQRKIPEHTGNVLNELREKLKTIANLSADHVVEQLKGHFKIHSNGKHIFTLKEVATVLGISTDKLIALGGGKLGESSEINESIDKINDLCEALK